MIGRVADASDAEYIADFRMIWTAAHVNCAEQQGIIGLNIKTLSLYVLQGMVAIMMESMLQKYIIIVANVEKKKMNTSGDMKVKGWLIIKIKMLSLQILKLNAVR